MSNYPSITISTFLGLDSGRDKLDLLPGQLIVNENYLYDIDGSLYERGGGDLLSASPSSGNPMYGLGNYQNNSGGQFLISVQGTSAYYYNAGWNTLGVTLTSNLVMRFENAGFGSGRALYGVNGTDSVLKISGTTPAGSFVASSPTDATQIKLHKNRLFAIDGKDKLYFTDSLAFDTWNTGANFIYIAPGKDGFLKAIEVWGDALFIFKERAIYVLPNAGDADPTTTWNILKTNASTGTLSPDTVRSTDDGIYFLASDQYIRRINSSISFSSGEYILDGSGASVMSYQIKQEMTADIDVSNIQKATAISFGNRYLFSYQTINNASSYNDRMYCLDVRKFAPKNQNIISSQDYAEPFTTKITGLNFNYMAKQTVTGQEVLYGIKGADGTTHSAFDDSLHNDNGSAIDSKAMLAWVAPGGESLLKRLRTVMINADVESWTIQLKFNSFRDGVIPSQGEGTVKEFDSISDIGSVVGTGIVGTATVGSIGQRTQRYSYDMYLRGYYFTIEFGNANADEFTRINSVTLYYEPIENK